VIEPIQLLLALVQPQDGIVRAIITKVSGGISQRIFGSSLNEQYRPQPSAIAFHRKSYRKRERL
jgi:hypothetical protein